MRQSDGRSLWSALNGADDLGRRHLRGVAASIALSDLVDGSSLGGRREELRGRSVLLAIADQLAAALALIELDGVARRMILCPSDLPPNHIAAISATADIDAIVFDGDPASRDLPAIGCVVPCRTDLAVAPARRGAIVPTEWILLTSGTTGVPKLVLHDLASLAGPTTTGGAPGPASVWSTFYDIRRYGGLQIFLRAILGGASLVLSSATEATAEFLARAGAAGVTHISGTPSHWRRALMSNAARRMAPRYVRLSGEIADQAILDQLHATYPGAGVTHAFATTEAGVGFEVDDRRAGFPAALIGRTDSPVELKIADGSLRIRSPRTARRYLGGAALMDGDGFVDTGDMVELSGDRYYFVGRRDGIINVGGFKVHPEEVEAVINAHPGVQMALVKSRRSPITGALVVAEVVVEPGAGGPAFEREILDTCRRALPRHKVPAVIRFVPSLAVTGSGKIARHAG